MLTPCALRAGGGGGGGPLRDAVEPPVTCGLSEPFFEPLVAGGGGGGGGPGWDGGGGGGGGADGFAADGIQLFAG